MVPATTTAAQNVKLIEDVKRLRRERSILKRAVLDEQESRTKLQESLYSMAKARRNMESEITAHQDEIDRLGFANEQLKKRITQMMKDWQSQNGRPSQEQTNSETLLGRLIGSSGSSSTDVQKLAEENNVLREELQIKIQENECIHMKQWELQQEHNEQLEILKKKVVQDRALKVRLEEENKAKMSRLEELEKDKLQAIQRMTKLQEKLVQQQVKTRERLSALSLRNEMLREETNITAQRFADKVPFDDSRNEWWKLYTVPSHDHEREVEMLQCGSRMINAMKDFLNESAQCIGALSKLGNLRKAHSESVIVPKGAVTPPHKLCSYVAEKLICLGEMIGSTLGPLFSYMDATRDAKKLSTPASTEGWEKLKTQMKEGLDAYMRLCKARHTGFGDAETQAADNLVSLLKSVFRRNFAQGTSSSSRPLNRRNIIVAVNENMDLIQNFRSCLFDLIQCVSQRLGSEQKQPFLSKALWNQLKTLQSSELKVLGTLERFSDACRKLLQRTYGGVEGRGTASGNPARLSKYMKMMHESMGNAGRRYMRWIRQHPLAPTSSHATASRSRKKLDALVEERDQIQEQLHVESLKVRRVESLLDETKEALGEMTRSRDAMTREMRRTNEERAVAELSMRETERQLRRDLVSARARASVDAIDQMNHKPETIAIGNGAAIINDQLSTPHQQNPAEVRMIPKYAIHGFDYDNIVRGISSLKLGANVRDREEEVKIHYENLLAAKETAIAAADESRQRLEGKYTAAIRKLHQLHSGSKMHERSVRDSNARVSRAKEELATTREAMAAQSKMLTQRVMHLEDEISKSKSMIEVLTNFELRCVHCHGWNRVGRLVGKNGSTMKACLHCNRSTGFRVLV